MKKIKVFITDDHYMVVEGIRALLQRDEQIEFIGHASNAASCLAFLRQEQPDGMLMDISMPDKNGMELCLEVKSDYPTIQILGLSTFDQNAFIEKMLENGASGYVLKNATKQELSKAIQMVYKGQKYLSPGATESLRTGSKVLAALPFITRREKEVLELIANGLTNAEIAEQLFITASAVNFHIQNIYLKLNVNSKSEALVKLKEMEAYT